MIECKHCKLDFDDEKYKIHLNEIYLKGQYFTTNETLKKFVNDLIFNKPDKILEPSIGRGDIIQYILKINNKIKFDMYEIDKTIKVLDCIDKDKIIYGDFLELNISETYDTIVGNPPYVKTKKGNLYLDFIYKCYCLLNLNGELIFIVPSDFIKLTSSYKLINEMLENGTFTHIIQPNKENLFINANIDVIIFRYCKNSNLEKKIIVNNEIKFLINSNGIITFENEKSSHKNEKFDEYFNIYVGIVSGKETFFKNDKYGNIKVLNGKDNIENYILVEKFPTDDLKLNDYFISNKKILIERKIRKFNEDNWFEWGALRNISSVKKNIGKKCIYIYNITRNEKVAFIDTVKFFGGGLIMLIPKKDINLDIFIKYLNSSEFKKNYMYSGRFKIGQRQLCNSLFDFSNLK